MKLSYPVRRHLSVNVPAAFGLTESCINESVMIVINILGPDHHPQIIAEKKLPSVCERV